MKHKCGICHYIDECSPMDENFICSYCIEQYKVKHCEN